MFLSTRDHGSLKYRVPKEWAGLPESLRATGSLVAFKRGLRGGFLAEYGSLPVVSEDVWSVDIGMMFDVGIVLPGEVKWVLCSLLRRFQVI